MCAAGVAHQRTNSGSGRTPAQLSNSCTTSAPASICAARCSNTASLSRSISRAKASGCASANDARGMEVRSLNRLRPCRPRASTAPRQSRSARSRRAGSAAPAGWPHRPARDVPIERRPQLLDRRRVPQRLELRARAILEPNPAAQRIRHYQDVGEQDRGIEAVASDGLQGGFRRELGRIAELEKVSCLAAQRAIFGQVAPGLAHQPDRRPCGWHFLQRIQRATSAEAPAGSARDFLLSSLIIS